MNEGTRQGLQSKLGKAVLPFHLSTSLAKNAKERFTFFIISALKRQKISPYR